MLWKDLRYGARMLSKDPGFTLIVVLTLALGIGANSIIFSFVNALLLRPLPVKDPERMVAVYTSDFSGARDGASSYPDYLDFRDRNRVCSELVAYQRTPFSLKIDGLTERAFGEIVSPNYFPALGIKSALGRVFSSEEGGTSSEQPAVVISYALWQNRFGGDPAVLGRVVRLNDRSFTIIGVAAEKYWGLTRGTAVDLWVPAMPTEQALLNRKDLVERGNRSFLVMGRLKPGLSLAQAQADFGMIAEQLFREWPESWVSGRHESRAISLVPERETQMSIGGGTPLVMWMALLMAVVGLVLLIACVNVANLLLARAAARRKEIAIRLSLGASRSRLIRQLMTESVMLALLSGAAGVLLAIWGTNWLTAETAIEVDLRADWRVLGFTFGLSLITGILFGLAPALAASRPDILATIKAETGTGIDRGRLRRALVVMQVALSLMLLICSGLFIRSLRQAGAVHVGFDADRLLVVPINLELQGYTEANGRKISEQLLSRVRTLPGIESASLSDLLPLGSGRSRYSLTIEGYSAPAGESTEVSAFSVAPGYFETLRIPVLRGRAFTTWDREGSPKVVVINETFARRYWPGQDPIGKHLRTKAGDDDSSSDLEVVGVAKDGKYATLGEEATPFFYLNLFQIYRSSPTLIVRTLGNPMDYLPAVRNEMATLDAKLPLYDVKTMRQHVELSLLPAQLAAGALGILGLVALILAAAGIYGVMAYWVAQRTREIGIRMAVGASALTVTKLVMKQGMRLAVSGIVLGLAASLILTRLIKTLLFGVSATDPLTFIIIALLLGSVALLACYVPARRAAKIDPMITLRSQ